MLQDGLFERIEQEPEETCIYKRIFLDYTYGLDKIYTREEIEKAKHHLPSKENIISNIWVLLEIPSIREPSKQQ